MGWIGIITPLGFFFFFGGSVLGWVGFGNLENLIQYICNALSREAQQSYFYFFDRNNFTLFCYYNIIKLLL